MSLVLLGGALLAQNPTITGVVNVAGNIPPGMPNYGLAQGSLFAVYGSNLGPPSLVSAPNALPTSGLAGTSIFIGTPGPGAIFNVPIVFTRSDVVVGVIPSNIPTGQLTLVLNYNGASATAPVTIVQSAFEISYSLIQPALNGIGVLGLTVASFENGQTITVTNSAKPGDTITLWGTGLGATPNNGGDTGPPPAGNIGTVPLVFVGGIQSPSVTYWGRSPGSLPGLDQINFVIPPNAPLGCNVGVVVEMMNGSTPMVSNIPTIPLAATDGATCSDVDQVIAPSAVTAETRVIDVQLLEHVTIVGSGTLNPVTQMSSAQVSFFSADPTQLQAFARVSNVQPSFGSCFAGIVASPTASVGPNGTPLNAGPAISLSSPIGQAFILPFQSSTGEYQLQNMPAMQSGTWNLTDGSGGPDVGPLNVNFPDPQQIDWTNQASVNTTPIDRTQPLTITWTGGDVTSYVDITGTGQITNAQGVTYTYGFECAEAVSAGQFTIPSSILLAMPPGASKAMLQVSTNALASSLGSVPGFNAAINSSASQTAVSVTFK